MCVAQDAHCQLHNVRAQKTELIVTRYLADIVLKKGSDKRS